MEGPDQVTTAMQTPPQEGKVIHMPPEEAQKIDVPMDEPRLLIKGDSKEDIEKRGYSLLSIRAKLKGDKPVDLSTDVEIYFDGKPLLGIGEIQLSTIPPFFSLTIVDMDKFNASVNKSGVLPKMGISVKRLLYGASYPAAKCSTCANEGREGWLRVEYGGRCDNPECPMAHPSLKQQPPIREDVPIKGTSPPPEPEMMA